MSGNIYCIVALVCISQVTNYVDYLHVLNYHPCIFAEMFVNDFILFNLKKKSEDLVCE